MSSFRIDKEQFFVEKRGAVASKKGEKNLPSLFFVFLFEFELGRNETKKVVLPMFELWDSSIWWRSGDFFYV